MLTTTLRPNGDTTTQWTGSQAGSHFPLVDDVTQDGDATYVVSSTTNRVERFTLAPVPSDFGTSASVRVKITAKASVGRDIDVELFIGGTGRGAKTQTIGTGGYNEYTVTLAGWNAGFWELDWDDADIQVTLLAGSGDVRITKIAVDVDYYKIVLLNPNEDSGAPAWTPSAGSDHYALVDEGADTHDADATYVETNTDGAADLYGLNAVPRPFGQSKGIEVRLAAKSPTGVPEDIDFDLVVNGTGQGTATQDVDTASYLTYRVSNTNWRNRDWSETQMNAAGLKMTYSKLGKFANPERVSAVQLAVSYDEPTVRGSVLTPRRIGMMEQM